MSCHTVQHATCCVQLKRYDCQTVPDFNRNKERIFFFGAKDSKRCHDSKRLEYPASAGTTCLGSRELIWVVDACDRRSNAKSSNFCVRGVRPCGPARRRPGAGGCAKGWSTSRKSNTGNPRAQSHHCTTHSSTSLHKDTDQSLKWAYTSSISLSINSFRVCHQSWLNARDERVVKLVIMDDCDPFYKSLGVLPIDCTLRVLVHIFVFVAHNLQCWNVHTFLEGNFAHKYSTVDALVFVIGLQNVSTYPGTVWKWNALAKLRTFPVKATSSTVQTNVDFDPWTPISRRGSVGRQAQSICFGNDRIALSLC